MPGVVEFDSCSLAVTDDETLVLLGLQAPERGGVESTGHQ